MPIYPHEFIESFSPSGSRNNCFVLMPFAGNFDDVYESIRSACESPEVLLSSNRADDFYGAGHIMEDILTGIMSSEYVVADLTGKNPNVFYELGIAHSSKAASKVVIISQSLDDIPFDLRHMRCIIYRNDPPGLRSLTRNLERAFLSDAKDLYRFVADEGRPFEFLDRLSGANRNFYTFTLDELHVGRGAVKFAITVHRQSLDEGNATLEPVSRYLEEGKHVPILPTDWEVRLDETRRSQAVFSVRRIEASHHPWAPFSPSAIRAYFIPGYTPSFRKLRDAMSLHDDWSGCQFVEEDAARLLLGISKRHIMDDSRRHVMFIDLVASENRHDTKEVLELIEAARGLGSHLSFKPIFVFFSDENDLKSAFGRLAPSVRKRLELYFQLGRSESATVMREKLKNLRERVDTEWSIRPASGPDGPL